MLGGMTAVTLNQFVPLPLAILLAVVITMIVGAVIEIVFIRWLYKPSVLRMVIITIGISILIREIALHIWGESVRALPYFTGSSVSSINLGGVYISSQVLWVVGIGGARGRGADRVLQPDDAGPADARVRGQPRRRPPLRHRHGEHGHPLVHAQRRDRRHRAAASSARSPTSSTTAGRRSPSRASPSPSSADSETAPPPSAPA